MKKFKNFVKILLWCLILILVGILLQFIVITTYPIWLTTIVSTCATSIILGVLILIVASTNIKYMSDKVKDEILEVLVACMIMFCLCAMLLAIIYKHKNDFLP